MAKEAYYFSHDSNARHDPKMTAMRSVYGSEGYGWFWIIVELMREADEYKLDMQGKYTFNAYAMQMHTECNTAEQFIMDCINEFNLFHSDNSFFWSPSLLRRMDMREQTSEKRREAANKRWGKSSKDANASKKDANAMQGKERKGNIKHIVDSDECDETFNRFWDAYPKKNGKAKAVIKWRSYFKQGLIDMEIIMKGLESYMSYVEHERNVRKFDRQYLDGLTFVNGERWNDDWTVNQLSQPKSHLPESRNTTSQLELITSTEEERKEHEQLIERIRRQNAANTRGASRGVDSVS